MTISSVMPLICGQKDEQNGNILINSEVSGKVYNVFENQTKSKNQEIEDQHLNIWMKLLIILNQVKVLKTSTFCSLINYYEMIDFIKGILQKLSMG